MKLTHTTIDKRCHSLNQLIMALSQVPRLNEGGCGIAALVMYRWLRDNGQLSYDTKLVFLYQSFEGDRQRYGSNKRRVRNAQYNLDVPAHIVLFHNGVHLDSTCIFGRNVDISDYENIQYIDCNLIEPVLLGCINHPMPTPGVYEDSLRWNTQFNRQTMIPMIENRTQINLSDINKQYV